MGQLLRNSTVYIAKSGQRILTRGLITEDYFSHWGKFIVTLATQEL